MAATRSHGEKHDKHEEAKGGAPKRRIAAVGDLHCTEDSKGTILPKLKAVDAEAEALLLCGDLTDRGTVEEAEILASELAPLRLPMIGVLGNHDYETGHGDEVRRILHQAGVHMLDGEAWKLDDELGFAGAKGFAGGFGDHVLQGWGEDPIKQFVMVATEEALKLETALAKLRTTKKVALLHYSPMRGTVLGEPPEIHAFLGTSRLQVPINRFHANAVFHGHAHRGTHHDLTNRDVPVYNVAAPVLRRMEPSRAYALVEI